MPQGRRVASRQRFPHARRVRRIPWHLVSAGSLAAVVALGVLVGGPALLGATASGVASLQADRVSGQEPTPGGSPAPDTQRAVSPSPSSPKGAPSAAPSPAASPAASGTADSPDLPLAAGTSRVPPVSALTGYVWPLRHGRVTLPFGPWWSATRVVDGKPFHDGMDMASFCGDQVLVAHDGVVLAAGRHFDNWVGWVGDLEPYYRRLNEKKAWSTLPLVVVIDDGNGYRSVYAHMWKLFVKPGDTVEAGQLLGYEGMTGHASGCHVHYSLFSPLETATFGIRDSTVKNMLVPPYEIARVDPFLVMPPRPGVNAPATPKPSPKPGPSATATPTPAP